MQPWSAALMWLLALQSFLFCLHRLTGTTEVHDDTANILFTMVLGSCTSLNNPKRFWFRCISAGGLTAAPCWVTFVLVYISGRPDGRTVLARLCPGVYQHSGLTAAVAAAPIVFGYISITASWRLLLWATAFWCAAVQRPEAAGRRAAACWWTSGGRLDT